MLSNLTFYGFPARGQNSEAIKTIDAKPLQKNSNKPINKFWMCEPDEFSSDHIENAKNINWLGSTFISDVEKMDKSVPVLYIKVWKKPKSS
jgi:hypothetical protein